MNLSRRALLQHPLAHQFGRAVDSLGAALAPNSVRQYRGTARNFLTYLGTDHPEVTALDQLRRDPHILGWMAKLRSRIPPLAPVTYISRLIFLRGTLQELASSAQLPELAQLLRRQDIPRAPRRLPRALNMQQDQLLQQELLRRNDLGANVLLVLRHTGMRIGEAADLSFDCLHASGTDQWAIHVPLGKLKTERMVPVDSFVCQLVQRLRFFRSLDPLPADGRLLARSSTREALIRKLRRYFHEVCAEAGIGKRIVPHQMRHYLPFRTMSCIGTGLRFGSMISGSVMQSSRQFARHSLVPAADCSGRRDGRGGVHSDRPLQSRWDRKNVTGGLWALRERTASLSMIKAERRLFRPTRS